MKPVAIEDVKKAFVLSDDELNEMCANIVELTYKIALSEGKTERAAILLALDKAGKLLEDVKKVFAFSNDELNRAYAKVINPKEIKD